MNIAVAGAGRIGSTFAYYLSRGGHDVTVVARGARLEALQKEGAIVSVEGARAAVKAAPALDPAQPIDLVLVTVLAHQVDALLPALQASAAKTVLFLFNTFERLDRWRDALGAERFAAGFPTMLASFEGERLRSTVRGPGMVTTLSSAPWAEVFQEAGLPAEVEPEMNAYLRSHVAFVVPMMLAAGLMWQRSAALTRAEASKLAGALFEGLAVVRALGHPLKPGFVALVARLPAFVVTSLIWAAARSASVREIGAFGPGEARALIDAMAAAAPGKTPKLLALRP